MDVQIIQIWKWKQDEKLEFEYYQNKVIGTSTRKSYRAY